MTQFESILGIRYINLLDQETIRYVEVESTKENNSLAMNQYAVESFQLSTESIHNSALTNIPLKFSNSVADAETLLVSTLHPKDLCLDLEALVQNLLDSDQSTDQDSHHPTMR